MPLKPSWTVAALDSAQQRRGETNGMTRNPRLTSKGKTANRSRNDHMSGYLDVLISFSAEFILPEITAKLVIPPVHRKSHDISAAGLLSTTKSCAALYARPFATLFLVSPSAGLFCCDHFRFYCHADLI
ncbi:hypothetical protein HDV62DRAFT_190075 [Trichoderma sp. SZMC 28011]